MNKGRLLPPTVDRPLVKKRADLGKRFALFIFSYFSLTKKCYRREHAPWRINHESHVLDFDLG